MTRNQAEHLEEYKDSLRESILLLLGKDNEELAEKIIEKAVNVLCLSLGGFEIVLPTLSRLKDSIRNEKIKCLYAKGIKVSVLVERFGLSRSQINRILGLCK